MSQVVTETDSLIEKESEQEIAERIEDVGRETNHYVDGEEQERTLPLVKKNL